MRTKTAHHHENIGCHTERKWFSGTQAQQGQCIGYIVLYAQGPFNSSLMSKLQLDIRKPAVGPLDWICQEALSQQVENEKRISCRL